MQFNHKKRIKVICVNCDWKGERQQDELDKKCTVCTGHLFVDHTHPLINEKLKKLTKQVQKIADLNITEAIEFKKGKKYLVVVDSSVGQEYMDRLYNQLRRMGIDPVITDAPIKKVKHITDGEQRKSKKA